MSLLCCVCLSIKDKMYDLRKSHLFEYYSKFINNTQTWTSLQSCYICYSFLKKSHKFMIQAVESYQTLLQIKDGKMIHDYQDNVFNLMVTKLESIVIDECNISVAQNEKTEEQELVKVENHNIDIIDESSLDFKLNEQSDTEDDDIPLIELKSEPLIKQDTEDKKYKENKKVNAREITLSQEEQIREMQERAKSINYLNSPYKCELCYRGFIDPTAFGKHKMKHDESSGAHACWLCHVRFASRRQLSAHARAAHHTRYQCALCHHLTHTRNQAKQHEEWHKGRTYNCNLCGKTFLKPSSYLTHVRKLHPSEHACAHCGRSFVSAYGLRMHAAKAHRNLHEDKTEDTITSDNYCKECDVQFNSCEAWKEHALTKHYVFDSRISTCPVCEEQVPLEQRHAHARAHAHTRRDVHVYEKTPALTTISCQHCCKSFTRAHQLRAHTRRAHLGLKYDRRLVCEHCGKHCTSLATLRYHQRRHNGERPYACDTCAATFSSKENLRIHQRTHTGERPYSCPVCGKKFTQKPALNRHFRVHSGAKPYECQYCSKRFNQSSSLKSHVNTIHLKLPRNKKNKPSSLYICCFILILAGAGDFVCAGLVFRTIYKL